MSTMSEKMQAIIWKYEKAEGILLREDEITGNLIIEKFPGPPPTDKEIDQMVIDHAAYLAQKEQDDAVAEAKKSADVKNATTFEELKAAVINYLGIK